MQKMKVYVAISLRNIVMSVWTLQGLPDPRVVIPGFFLYTIASVEYMMMQIWRKIIIMVVI